MSYVLHYKPNDQTSFSLQSVVGADGQLYWMGRSVSLILGSSPDSMSRHPFAVQFKNVVGELPGHSNRTLHRKLLNHEVVSEIFAKHARPDVREFGEKLNSPETRVTVLHQNRVLNYWEPARVLLHDEGTDLFIAWNEFFKQKALHDLHNEPLLDLVDLGQELKVEEEEEKDIPEVITMFWKGRILTYKRI